MSVPDRILPYLVWPESIFYISDGVGSMYPTPEIRDALTDWLVEAHLLLPFID